MGDLDLIYYMFLVPTRVLNPSSILIDSAFFAGLTNVTD